MGVTDDQRAVRVLQDIANHLDARVDAVMDEELLAAEVSRMHALACACLVRVGERPPPGDPVAALCAKLEACHAQLAKAKEHIRLFRDALQPFVRSADSVAPDVPDHLPMLGGEPPTIGDCRRARRVLGTT